MAILAAAQGSVWRVAGWAHVLAGFGSFPLLIAAALIAVRKPSSQDAGGEATVRHTPRLKARSTR